MELAISSTSRATGSLCLALAHRGSGKLRYPTLGVGYHSSDAAPFVPLVISHIQQVQLYRSGANSSATDSFGHSMFDGTVFAERDVSWCKRRLGLFGSYRAEGVGVYAEHPHDGVQVHYVFDEILGAVSADVGYAV